MAVTLYPRQPYLNNQSTCNTVQFGHPYLLGMAAEAAVVLSDAVGAFEQYANIPALINNAGVLFRVAVPGLGNHMQISGGNGGIQWNDRRVGMANVDCTLVITAQAESSPTGRAIGTSTVTNGGYHIETFGTSPTHWVFTLGGVLGGTTGPVCTQSVPYFVAATYRASDGSLIIMARNLQTFALETVTTTMTGPALDGDGDFNLGESTGIGSSFGGRIGMGVWGFRYCPRSLLEEWSLDPYAILRPPSSKKFFLFSYPTQDQPPSQPVYPISPHALQAASGTSWTIFPQKGITQGGVWNWAQPPSQPVYPISQHAAQAASGTTLLPFPKKGIQQGGVWGWDQPTSQPVRPLSSHAALAASGTTLLPFPAKGIAQGGVYGWDQPPSQPIFLKPYNSALAQGAWNPPGLKYGWEQPTEQPVRPTSQTSAQASGTSWVAKTIVMGLTAEGWQQPTSQPFPRRTPAVEGGVTWISPALIQGWDQQQSQPVQFKAQPNLVGTTWTPPSLKYGWEQPTGQPSAFLAKTPPNVASGGTSWTPPALAHEWDQPPSQPVRLPHVQRPDGTVLPSPALVYGWEQPVSQPIFTFRTQDAQQPFSLALTTLAWGWDQPTSQPIFATRITQSGSFFWTPSTQQNPMFPWGWMQPFPQPVYPISSHAALQASGTTWVIQPIYSPILNPQPSVFEVKVRLGWN